MIDAPDLEPEPDETGEPVDHPDLPELFGDFEDGFYPLQVQLN